MNRPATSPPFRALLLRIAQDLAWLRTILYLSQDLRGNRGSVVEVDRAYGQLTAAFGPGHVLTPGLRALATLVASPALKALREPVQYFHQAFTGDYWVISAYLLGRYESDPALAALYRDVMARVVWPLVDDIDAPMHLYALLSTITDPTRFAAVAGISSDISVLFIEHDMELVFRFASRIIVMVSGRILLEGAPEEIATDARVREVYLGRGHG